MPGRALHPGLRLISLLFSYPDGQWFSAPLPAGAGAETAALLEEMRGIEPVRLENEYVRLFINAMPELPCAPYGSVYLEGSVMGESTLKIADIYRKYGMATVEPADHIAVESEFLTLAARPGRRQCRAPGRTSTPCSHTCADGQAHSSTRWNSTTDSAATGAFRFTSSSLIIWDVTYIVNVSPLDFGSFRNSAKKGIPWQASI
jgi:hypothetical protein